MNIDERKALMIQCMIDCEVMCAEHESAEIEELARDSLTQKLTRLRSLAEERKKYS